MIRLAARRPHCSVRIFFRSSLEAYLPTPGERILQYLGRLLFSLQYPGTLDRILHGRLHGIGWDFLSSRTMDKWP